MAEDQQTNGQNLWLLLVSLGLGLVVVVIYNVHMYNVRRENRGKTVGLIRVTRNIDAGERLKEEDLEIRALPKQYEGSLGNVVPGERKDLAVGETVNRRIEKNSWLLWDYITGLDLRKSQIGPGNVAIAVPLDSKMSPGDILRINDQVNILAMIGNGGALKTYRILQGIRVLAIDGVGMKPDGVRTNRVIKRKSTYRSITIELPTDVSKQLANVLTHVSGGCWVELRRTGDGNPREFNRINPELKKLADAPARPLPGEAPRGGGVMGGAIVPGGKPWE